MAIFEETASEPQALCSVAIVGGGLGGVAAAIALTKAGHKATIFEQAEEFSEVE